MWDTNIVLIFMKGYLFEFRAVFTFIFFSVFTIDFKGVFTFVFVGVLLLVICINNRSKCR